MLRFQTRWLAYPAVLLVAFGIYFMNPEQSAHADGLYDMSLECDDEELNQQRICLEARQKIVVERMAFKDALLTELVEGRATLKQVAGEFLRVNRTEECCINSIRQHFTGNSDEEKCARNVMQHAMCRELTKPKKASLQARLECEFHAMYNQLGVAQ